MNETKEHILQTSLLLFLQKSFKEVTMKEIVESTGLSKGAFYHYFQSKEELFKEIAHLFFSMGVLDYNSFPQHSLESFYRHYLEHINISFQQINDMVAQSGQGDNSINFFLIMFDAINRFPEFLEMELQQYNQAVAAWEKVIAIAKSKGEISSDTSDREIADLFLYTTDGVFIRYLNSTKSGESYYEKLTLAFNSIYLNIKP